LKNKQLGILSIVVVETVILYFLTIGLATDAMDGFVEMDLAVGQIPDMSIINFILAVSTLVLFGSFGVAFGFMLHDENRGVAIILIAFLWACVMIGVSFYGMMGQPEFQISPDKWLIVPALYASFVLRSPSGFIVIEAITLCLAIVIIGLLLRLDE